MVVFPPSDIALSEKLLTDFFGLAYAERFVGTEAFSQFFVREADVAICLDTTENLHAAALIRSTRITAAGTHPDVETHGRRFLNFITLLKEIHTFQPESWTTIGLDVSDRIRAYAETAGMQRSMDVHLLQRRLQPFGGLGTVAIRETDDGLLIASKLSSKGPDYWQEVWDWSESSTIE